MLGVVAANTLPTGPASTTSATSTIAMIDFRMVEVLLVCYYSDRRRAICAHYSSSLLLTSYGQRIAIVTITHLSASPSKACFKQTRISLTVGGGLEGGSPLQASPPPKCKVHLKHGYGILRDSDSLTWTLSSRRSASTGECSTEIDRRPA